MNVILLYGKRYKAPSKWDEISEKQFIAWAAACLKRLDIGDCIRLCIKVFYNIPLLPFLRMPESWRIQIAPTLGFLFEKQLPVKWVIKVIRPSTPFRITKYYGPDDRLANCTINELRYALIFYQAYTRLKDKGDTVENEAEECLDQLIATLYRPKRKGIISHDIREDLTDYGVRQRASLMRKLPAKVRHAILLNFEGCYAHIKKNYLDKLPKEGKASEGLFDFNGIIRTVSGGKFGPKAQTEQTLIYDFLEHLVENAEEVERMKRGK